MHDNSGRKIRKKERTKSILYFVRCSKIPVFLFPLFEFLCIANDTYFEDKLRDRVAIFFPLPNVRTNVGFTFTSHNIELSFEFLFSRMTKEGEREKKAGK